MGSRSLRSKVFNILEDDVLAFLEVVERVGAGLMIY